MYIDLINLNHLELLDHYLIILFITDLQSTTLALDFRVTVLEENGGGGGNSSVAELEVRVQVLEGTTADHETRISTTESSINGKLHSNTIKLKLKFSINR